MVALVGLGDQFVDLAACDLTEDAVALADRQQDGVEHLVDALDDVGIAAFEARGIATLLQLALVAVFDQLGQFRLEPLQHERNVVDVLLHLFMIALVGLGDQFVDLAVRHLVEDAVALADRQQDGVQHLIDAVDDLAEHALEAVDLATLF